MCYVRERISLLFPQEKKSYGYHQTKYPSSRSQKILDIQTHKEESIIIQEESPSKETSDLWYQSPLQDKIALPKHLYILTSLCSGSPDSKIKADFGVGLWLFLSLNPNMLPKEKFSFCLISEESPGMRQKKNNSRVSCCQNFLPQKSTSPHT